MDTYRRRRTSAGRELGASHVQLGLVSNVDIKVQHFLADAELFVKCDRWAIAVVGLDVDDPGATRDSDFAQSLEERGCNTTSAVRLRNRKIKDIQLSPGALDLVEFVRYKPADNLPRQERNEHDQAFLV